MELAVSLRSRAVSHFITLSPRLGIMHIPLAAVVERNSLMAKHHGFSSTHFWDYVVVAHTPSRLQA